MSPARTAEQAQQVQQVEALTTGFDALLETARRLAFKERELQLKLEFAHNEVCTRVNQSYITLFLHTLRAYPSPLEVALHDEIYLISSRSGAAFAAVTE